MILTYHGGHSIKLVQGGLTVAINPPSAASKLKSSRYGADIVLQSARHEDVAGGTEMSAGQKEPFVINGPGEYEKDGLFIYGLASKTTYEGSEATNTIFYFEFDEVKFCVLGLHEGTSLPTEATEIIDEVDVLILPITGNGVLDPVSAHKLAVKMEPKAIIPTGFTEKKDANLATFLQEYDSQSKPIDKLTFKAKDLPPTSTVFVLEPQ